MAFTVQETEEVRKVFMRYYGIANQNKPVIRTAIEATDAWVDDETAKAGGITNQAHYVTYLTANASAFAANSTIGQKSTLFALVLMQRAGLLDKVR